MIYFEDDRLSDEIAAQHAREDTCTCGHPRLRHSSLGPCMVIVPTQMMRADGEPARIERTYCACWSFK